MRDSFSRSIDYLRLSVTELCDLRCAYCMPPEGVCKREQRDICSLEELEELAAACVALGVKKIRLTGGEPLVRRGILRLVERLAALKALGLEELTMTTNGQRLAEFAVLLREAGLDRLNVSLDTLRPDRYRSLTGGGELDRVLAGLEAAEAAGFGRTSLNAVLLKGVNDDELAALADLARTRPLSVRFIELMPLGPAAERYAETFLPAAAVLEAVPELRPLDRGEAQNQAAGNTAFPAAAHSVRHDNHAGTGPSASGVACLYTAPGWAGTVGLIAPMSACFCADCRRIRITADGKLKPCLHSAEEFPLRGLHGEELKAAVSAAIQKKPERHHLTDSALSESARPMSEIGG